MMRRLTIPAPAAVDATVPTPPAGALRLLRHGAIFLAALLLAGVLLDRWLPYPDIPVSGEKIRYLARHGGEYDTLFIGSSRVNFQILPSLFDQARAEAGAAAKSFNAGILGMRPPEQGFYLEHVLRQPHDQLRWVFIELTSLEARTPKSRTRSARFAFWHDAPRLGLLWIWCRTQWAALRERPAANPDAEFQPTIWNHWEPLSVWLGHVPPFVRRTVNLGRMSFLSERWLLPAPKRAREQNKWRALGKNRDGWTPSGTREVMNEQETQTYRQSYEDRLATPARQFHDPASDAAIQAMREAVARTGATPIFFVPPMTSERIYYPPAEMAEKMIIWNFSDPQRYPELFTVESRLDPIHLNTAGAEIFTRILAQRFTEFAR